MGEARDLIRKIQIVVPITELDGDEDRDLVAKVAEINLRDNSDYRSIAMADKMLIGPSHAFLEPFSLDLRQLQQQFIERVEDASGKPVILQSDPKFAGHAAIKIAKQDQPAHLLPYKPEHESVLPYLVAHECEFALRTIQADPSTQFNIKSKSNMHHDVLGMMQRHHKGKDDDVPSHVVPQLNSRQTGNTSPNHECDNRFLADV